MAYMFADEINGVLTNKSKIDNKEIVSLLVEKFYEEIVTPNNQRLLDLAFNDSLNQRDLDKFLIGWELEQYSGDRALMLSYLMKERSDLHFPETVRPRLAGLFNYYRFQNLQLITHFTKICRALNDNNIVPMILKGGAMKYMRPELPRVMGDIDILVHPADYKKACEISRNLGYYFEDNEKAHSVDLHLSEDDEAGVLDIHRWIYLNSKYDIGFMDKFFERATKHKIFGADVYLPSKEDMLFICLLNLAKNLHKNTSIKGVLYSLFDCRYLISSTPDFNWNLILENTIQTNTQVQMYFAMKFANRIVPNLLPQELFENKQLEKKINKYCNMVMFTRFYVDELRMTCKKIRIKQALCHMSVMKEYLKYKPKYFMLKMMKKSSWAVERFLKIMN